MRHYVIADYTEFALDDPMNHILHPGCIAGNGGAGNSDAEPLDLVWGDVRGLARPSNNAVQGSLRLLISHLGDFAALTCGLPQQRFPVADGTISFRTAGVNSHVEWHGVVLSSHNFHRNYSITKLPIYPM
jgi:hypothetical protein